MDLLSDSRHFASQLPHDRHLVSQSEIWMALFMIYLPPLFYFRNNGSIVITACANIACLLFISLPVYLIELLTGAFSYGSLLRAYSYNRYAKIMLGIIVLQQFQNLTSGTANSHKVLTFSMTFYLQSFNPHLSLWNCHNVWNTDQCCMLLAPLNSSIGDIKNRKARCSTPFEEFFKFYGNIFFSGIYQPSGKSYDGGHAQMIAWLLLTAFLLFMAQLSLGSAIRFITYTLTVPGLLLLAGLFLRCFREPLTSGKITNLLTRSEKFDDEYTFTFFMPNLYYANHMMIGGGYLVVLHCCRRPHRNERQLTSVLAKNIALLVVLTVAYKCTICVLRHGTVGIINLTRQRMAGFRGSFDREKHRDLFEDSKDWIFQNVFDAIEVVYALRQEFGYKNPWNVLDGATVLYPVMLYLGFIGVRIVIFKTTMELIFQSAGFSELLTGPWQMLTRLSIPLSLVGVCLAGDSDLFRDALFPKEPYGFAFCSINCALFLPSLIYASVVQQTGVLSRSLYWRMMQYALKFKRRLIILGIFSGLHLSGAQVYKNIYVQSFKKVLDSNNLIKLKILTPRINYFFDYDIGVFGSNALRVFSFSGRGGNWALNDTFYALVGIFSLILGILHSKRVLKFLKSNWSTLHTIFCKPARCFRYCIEFYFVLIFDQR